jgi:hydroxypyruvate isomerase
MDRRSFIRNTGLAAGTFLAAGSPGFPAAAARTGDAPKFKMKYAPHFGMFENLAGKDLLDQLRFAADQGFTAFEDNGMPGKPADLQRKIAAEMARLGLTMGVFVAYADFGTRSFVLENADVRDMLKQKMHDAVEVAKRVNAKWSTVVPGQYDTKLEWDYQTENVIENLKWCASICEPAGLVMVLEPLNAHTDHPGLFLTKVPQAYMICKAVGSPSCKILDDLYHQQVTEGNLIPNINMAYDQIGYFQVGDNPGRKEPTTGEINYRNVFRHLFAKGWTGLIGMEHGISKPGKEGELAAIQAYRECDAF